MVALTRLHHVDLRANDKTQHAHEGSRRLPFSPRQRRLRLDIMAEVLVGFNCFGHFTRWSHRNSKEALWLPGGLHG